MLKENPQIDTETKEKQETKEISAKKSEKSPEQEEQDNINKYKDLAEEASRLFDERYKVGTRLTEEIGMKRGVYLENIKKEDPLKGALAEALMNERRLLNERQEKAEEKMREIQQKVSWETRNKLQEIYKATRSH